MAKKMVFQPGMTAKGSLGKENDSVNKLAAQNKYNFKYISRDKIVKNEKNNRFDQLDLESLKESILQHGLFHNLVVINVKGKNETFRLISGERRYSAIMLMTPEEYASNFPSGIPCKVQVDNLSDVDEEIEVISANTDQRTRSLEKTLEDVQRLQELYKMKEKKGEIKNIPKRISEKLGMTEAQIRKYVKIGNLIPELSDALKKKEISLEDASRFASLGEHEQMLLSEILQEEGSVSKEDYETVKKVNEEARVQIEETEEELKNAQNMLQSKDAQIEKLNTLLEEAKKEKMDTGSLENVIAKTEKKKKELEEKNNTLAEKRKSIVGVSKEELKKARKKTKLEKLVDSFEDDIKRLEEMWDEIETDADLYVKVMMLLEKLNKFGDDGGETLEERKDL